VKTTTFYRMMATVCAAVAIITFALALHVYDLPPAYMSPDIERAVVLLALGIFMSGVALNYSLSYVREIIKETCMEDAPEE